MPNADVFISYKRDQRPQVEKIAERLQELGLTVWFDAWLESGTSFDEEINQEVRSAKAVLVCWTASAVGSRWVRAEALIGLERGVLTAASLEPVELMPPFNLIHAEDLAGWQGNVTHLNWCRLVDRIKKFVHSPHPPVTARMSFVSEPKVRFNRMPPPRKGERWAEVAMFRAGRETFPFWTEKESFLNALEWSSSDKSLFTAGQVSGLRAWNENGSERTRMKVKASRFYTGCIAVADFRSSPLVATAGHGPLCIWRDREISWQHPFTNEEYVTALAWQNVPDYTSNIPALAASVSHEGYGGGSSICLWDVHTGVQEWSHPCPVSYRLHWSLNGDYLAVPQYSGDGFEIFQLDGTRISLKTRESEEPNRYYYRARAGFAWHTSGRYFATGISDREIGIYELPSATQVRTLVLDAAHRAQGSSIRSVQWSADGRYLAISTPVGTTVIFDVGLGAIQAALYDTGIEPNDLAFSPDGQRLATRGKEGLKLWDPARGEIVAAIPSAGSWIRQIRWHPDSRRIAFAHDNGRVKIAQLEL